MSFRRDGKSAHEIQQQWSAWRDSNKTLIAASGLPPNVVRSRANWRSFLDDGYHCDEHYGQFINKVDFSVEELNTSQLEALRQLLTTWELENTAVGHFLVGPPHRRTT